MMHTNIFILLVITGMKQCHVRRFLITVHRLCIQKPSECKPLTSLVINHICQDIHDQKHDVKSINKKTQMRTRDAHLQ